MLNPRHACSEWLIDEGGNLWPVGVPALRQKLGSELPWGYLKRYAVENVGYCLVARRTQGVHVCLRPEVIAQPTLAAAMYWLIEQRAPRLVISILRQTWTHRLLTSDAAAVSLLSAEADARLLARRDDYLCRRRSLGDLPHFHPLADLMRHVGERNHVYSTEAFQRLVDGPLRRRALVLAPSDDARKLTIKEWGSGYRTYSRLWLSHSKGLNVEDQRDFVYASKAATSYRVAWAQHQCVLEDVDARVLDEAGKLNHVRYTRVIIPMTDAGGQPVLVGASVVNPTVDICPESIQEP